MAGIDEFLDQVTVLPPGEWDPSIRIEPPKNVPSQVGAAVEGGVRGWVGDLGINPSLCLYRKKGRCPELWMTTLLTESLKNIAALNWSGREGGRFNILI